MLLSRLVETSKQVAQTRARSTKISLLAEALAELDPQEIRIGTAYLTGELPQGKIGVGYAKVSELSSTTPAQAPSLQVSEVDHRLNEVKNLGGAGSARAKSQNLRQLFSLATPNEQRFLTLLLVGELRQGAQQGLIADAVARAAHVSSNSVRRALMVSGSITKTAEAALLKGESGLDQMRLNLFTPLLPMLAQTTDSSAEALSGKRALRAEFKLDGARVQVHKQGELVRVYSRKLNDVTHAVPELVELARSLPAQSLILDGETIALRPDGRPQPFQTTMRRFGRRLDVEALAKRLPLSSFFFDCLHADGQDLLELTEQQRGQKLAELAPPDTLIPHTLVRSEADIHAFLEQSLSRGHEGLMLKDPEAPYEAGRRGAGWLKLKPVHTLDLVVLAVEWGSGRRKGWLSNLHLGARDPAGGFVMLGKTFKGMTDELLRWQTDKLSQLSVGSEGHVVHVRPELVVEVAFDGLQKSPQYPGGLALRFARVRRYRTDKTAAQADTIELCRQLYEQQNA